MSRFVRGFVLALAGVIGLGVAAHAKDMTLDDCIELALKNRASIIAARGAADLAKMGQTAALGAFLPHASASWSSITSQANSQHVSVVASDSTLSYDLPDTKRTNTQFNIGANWGFSLPDALFDYMTARTNRQAAQLDVIGSEQDLILAVKQAYYAYLASVQNQTVSEDAVKRSEEQLKLIQSRFDLGSAAKSDVLTQKVLYGNDQLALLQAKNAVTNDKATLAYTVGLDPAQEQSFDTTFVTRQSEGTLDEAIKFGMEHKPSLLAMEKSLQSSKTVMNKAWSDYLPKIGPTASYGYDWSKSSGKVNRAVVPPPIYVDQVTTSHLTSLTYGIQASWNLFDGFSRELNVTSAKVARNNANAQLADARNLVSSQIKTAYLNIQQYKEQKNVAQTNVDAATENLKISQEKYNLGAATILDLLNAQVSLRQAQVSLIQADFDLNLAISGLENAMGKM